MDWTKVKSIFEEEKEYDWEVLKTKFEPIEKPIEPEFKLEKAPEVKKTLWDKVKTLFEAKPEVRIAKAQVSYNISQKTGIPILEVERNLPKITKDLGIRGVPTSEEFLTAMFAFPVTAQLIANPISVGIGVAKFIALTEVESLIISKFKKWKYKFGAGVGLKELLPEETNQLTKDLVDVADVVGKIFIIAKTDPKLMKIWKNFTQEISTEYTMPKNVYVSAGKVKSIFRTLPPHKLSVEELQLIKDLGLTGSQYRNAVKKGIDIEIPASKITTITDRPYWAKLKTLFNVKPVSETVVTRGGKIAPAKLMIEGKVLEVPPKVPEVEPVIKPIPTEPEVKPILPIIGKVSKIAKAIETKSIEAGLTKGFGHLAEYTPIVIKEQAKRASDLINTNIDEARRIIRGEKLLPEGLKGTALITAMEEHIKNTADGELASELAVSPLVSGTSAAAQELRLAAEREPTSPVKAIEDINKELQKTAERKLPGKILGKAKADTISRIKNNIKNANTRYSWETFIGSIRC